MGDLDGFFVIRHRTVGAGDRWHPGLLRDDLRLHLVAEVLHRLNGRADEGDLARPADVSETPVLGEEAIPGVYRLDIGDLRRGDDVLHPEIGLRDLGRADAVGLIREL